MAFSLDHTIVPANDKEESVRFIAGILGLEYKGPWGHFAPLKINDSLTLDFDNHVNFEGHHYAHLASDEEFDAILKRVQKKAYLTVAVLVPRTTAKSTICIREEDFTSMTQTAIAGKSLLIPILLTPTNSETAAK